MPVVNGNQVLLIDQTNPFQDGVYTVNASAAWTPSAYIGANMPYGLRTWVQSGDNYGGRYIYLASHRHAGRPKRGVYTASTGTLGVPGTGVWQLDADGPANVNVALLTSGNQTIAKDINVVANSSTGTSTLGEAATQAVSSAFTGNITLNKNLVLTFTTAQTPLLFRGISWGAAALGKLLRRAPARSSSPAAPTVTAAARSFPRVCSRLPTRASTPFQRAAPWSCRRAVILARGFCCPAG